MKVSRKDWIIVPDTHEGIVTQEEFDRAQAAVREFAERTTVNKPIRRKIYCGVCGHAMARMGSVKRPYYVCRTSYVTDSFACSGERILEQDLFAVLLDDLHTQAAAAVELERIWKEQHRREKQNIDAIRKSLSKLKEALAQQKREATKLYERFGLGEISKAEYLELKAAASQQKDSIAAKINELETALDNSGSDGQLENQFVSSFQKYVDAGEITDEIVDDLLMEVRVYPEERLEIVWNYREAFKRMMRDVTGY